MPNWTKNHTIFIGATDTITKITEACTTSASEFDFEQLLPTPEFLSKLNAQNRSLDIETYCNVFGSTYADLYLPMPTTLADFERFIDAVDPEKIEYDGKFYNPLDYYPETIREELINTYGATDWYDWRVDNWGTKWTGSDLIIDYMGNTMLAITYNTAWDTPRELFHYLLKTYPDLTIINGADHEDDDDLDINFGSPDAFYTYYTLKIANTIDINSDPDNCFSFRNQICTVNLNNINMLHYKGLFVDEEAYFKKMPQ